MLRSPIIYHSKQRLSSNPKRHSRLVRVRERYYRRVFAGQQQMRRFVERNQNEIDRRSVIVPHSLRIQLHSLTLHRNTRTPPSVSGSSICLNRGKKSKVPKICGRKQSPLKLKRKVPHREMAATRVSSIWNSQNGRAKKQKQNKK